MGIDQEKQHRQEWVESIAQGEVKGYEGHCLKCDKPFKVSLTEKDDNDLITLELKFHEECTKEDPEIMDMVKSALNRQPAMFYNRRTT